MSAAASPFSKSTFRDIRSIDNTRRYMPIVSFLLTAFTILIFVWFFRGGSFRLYASTFFSFYALTGQIWMSVLLVGLAQSLVFLPMRFIGLKFADDQEKIEEELDKVKTDDQYILFTEKVRKGNLTIVYFIFNFILNVIAFFSAGRIFLIDFYTHRLDPKLLYHFVPYPDYPLSGTDFKFPFFRVTDTFSVNWSQIFYFWLVVVAVLIVPRLIWRLVRFLFWKNQKILSIRIRYNRLLITAAGATGTIFLLATFLMRHIPTSFAGYTVSIDLTRQNTGFNLFTAIITFITVLHAGYTRNRITAAKARAEGIGEKIISSVFRENMRDSVRNALFLGLGAFFITNQIPSAFELSVATFEFIYILSPLTFDRLLIKASSKARQQDSTLPAD